MKKCLTGLLLVLLGFAAGFGLEWRVLRPTAQSPIAPVVAASTRAPEAPAAVEDKPDRPPRSLEEIRAVVASFPGMNLPRRQRALEDLVETVATGDFQAVLGLAETTMPKEFR